MNLQNPKQWYAITNENITRINKVYKKWTVINSHYKKMIKVNKRHHYNLEERIESYFHWHEKIFSNFEKNYGVLNKTYIEHIQKGTSAKDHWILLTGNNKATPWPKVKKQYKPDIRRILMKEERRKIQIRTQELKTRMSLELIEAYNRGEYIIYNTLTVSPQHYREVFKKESKHWREYIKKCEQRGQRTYAAILETDGRNHIHTIQIFKTIPQEWKIDPNSTTQIPYRRELNPVKRLWPWGWSTPIPVRFNAKDAWSKLGWKWIITKEGKLQETTLPGQLAGYLAKYLTKSRTKGEYQWRTRIKKNFGLEPIQNILNKMTEAELNQMNTMKNETWKIGPIYLSKATLTTQILKNLKERGMNLPKPQDASTQPDIIKVYKTSTQPKRIHSSWNSDEESTTSISNTDSFNLRMKWKNLTEQYAQSHYKPITGWTEYKINKGYQGGG